MPRWGWKVLVVFCGFTISLLVSSVTWLTFFHDSELQTITMWGVSLPFDVKYSEGRDHYKDVGIAIQYWYDSESRQVANFEETTISGWYLVWYEDEWTPKLLRIILRVERNGRMVHLGPEINGAAVIPIISLIILVFLYSYRKAKRIDAGEPESQDART